MILVVGATGALGREVSRQLLAAGHGAQMLNRGGADSLTRKAVAAMYVALSGRQGEVRHVPAAAMRIVSALVKPFNTVVSRLMAMSIWNDTTDQTFDARQLLPEHPASLTRVQDFIREQVSAAAGAAAASARISAPANRH